MKEYLDFLKEHFSSLEKNEVNRSLNFLIRSQIKYDDKLPFNNNFKLFEGVISSISDIFTKENDIDDISLSYAVVNQLYNKSEHNLDKELEVELYTNLFNLSVVTSTEKIKYLFNIFSNKYKLLLLTNYIIDNKGINKLDFRYDFIEFFNYILQVRILFKDENSYLSYVINFINRFTKEKEEFYDEDINLYLQEFMYLDNIDEKLLESIKEKENSTSYKELMNNFNSKEKMDEEIDNKLNTLTNNYSSRINKLKEMKEKLINLNTENILFYDKSNNFNDINYEDVKDYILYLIEYKNKHFNNCIFDIIKSLLKEKSTFIDIAKYSLIFNSIDQISDLLNTEIIKINYSDINLLKDINLDNNKKYLACITLSDKYDFYEQSNILDLENRFNNDNFRFIYINCNQYNVLYNGLKYKTDIKLNENVKVFIKNISYYMTLNNEQKDMFNKYYESKLFDLEDIFELLFNNIKIDISIINSSYDDELTKKFVDYLIRKKNNLVKIR